MPEVVSRQAVFWVRNGSGVTQTTPHQTQPGQGTKVGWNLEDGLRLKKPTGAAGAPQ
jgi:hypothetical protein